MCSQVNVDNGGAICAAELRNVRYLDLFSGTGAVRYGFEQACKEKGIGTACVGFSEIEPYAISTYLRHYPGTPALGDIAVLAASGDIPDCDLILAGFNCQAFSRAGLKLCLLYTSPSPRDRQKSRMPSSA